MGEPAKYLFDLDFSNPSGRGNAATAADVARKVSEAEARGHRNGVAAGLAQANAQSARRSAMALVADCMQHLVSTPHLVVRVNDTVYEQTKFSVEQIAHRYGFEGRLVILAEPEIAHGDCRIEWADGGIVLDRATTDAKIAELVAQYMATRGVTESAK